MQKRTLLGLTAATLLSLPLTMTAAHAETVREEAYEHPQIVRGIHELQETIKYLEAAGHDFGGHKGKALELSRAAIVELQEALRYRARRDRD